MSASPRFGLLGPLTRQEAWHETLCVSTASLAEDGRERFLPPWLVLSMLQCLCTMTAFPAAGHVPFIADFGVPVTHGLDKPAHVWSAADGRQVFAVLSPLLFFTGAIVSAFGSDLRCGLGRTFSCVMVYPSQLQAPKLDNRQKRLPIDEAFAQALAQQP